MEYQYGEKSHFTDQIAYIKTSEIDSRDKDLILNDRNGDYSENINFKTLLEMLPEKDFVQINKKEIIALKSIKVVSANEIITNISEDGEHFTKLHISEVYKADLMEKLGN